MIHTTSFFNKKMIQNIKKYNELGKLMSHEIYRTWRF